MDMVLQFASEQMNADKIVVFEAVTQDVDAFEFAFYELKEDEEVLSYVRNKMKSRIAAVSKDLNKYGLPSLSGTTVSCKMLEWSTSSSSSDDSKTKDIYIREPLLNYSYYT